MYNLHITSQEDYIYIKWIRIHSDSYSSFINNFNSKFRTLIEETINLTTFEPTSLFVLKLNDDIEVLIWISKNPDNKYFTFEIDCELRQISDILQVITDKTMKIELIKEIFNHV